MIYLDVIGRCGNQMFQYAFAKRIALLTGDTVSINFSLLEGYKERFNGDETFRDELFNFELYKQIEKHDTVLNVKEHGSFSQRFVYKLYSLTRKLLGRIGKDPHKAEILYRNLLARKGIYIDNGWARKPFKIKSTKQKNIFIKGYFENTVYLECIRDELLKDFTLSSAISGKNAAMLDKIKNSQSVCVSFRKWEVGGRDFDTPNYYKNAISYITERVENPLFVIFSNDVEWVKANFSLPENCIFEEADNTISDKIHLMSSCRHFIITNSTFCWWTQFLGTDKDKIVVCPEKWLADYEGENPLKQKEFVII